MIIPLTQSSRRLQPWIHSALVDCSVILFPAIITSFLVVFYHVPFQNLEGIPVWPWVSLIVCVDVAHVYSSLYRTYFDREELKRRSVLYVLTPILCWVVGAILYTTGALIFWSALAYLAVYHFIRQQYGFMKIYSWDEKHRLGWIHYLDNITIYAAMLYPLLYWHSHLPRNFSWFVEGDFIAFPKQFPTAIFFNIYIAILILYSSKEIYLYFRFREINIPRNLLIMGTAFSWYTGIVSYNGDLAFTATNVIAHGIPYISLIWIYCHNKWTAPIKQNNRRFSLAVRFYSLPFLPLFLGLLIVFGYFEEGIWDIFIWRDHPTVFGEWTFLTQISDHHVLSWLVPLLALPQSVHYVLDGFIWKMNGSNPDLKKVLFKKKLLN